VLVKVAPLEPVHKPKPTRSTAPEPAPRPVQAAAPKPAPVKTPVQAVVAPPVVRSLDDPIAGSITAVKGLMVMVDVGKDYGVDEGMRLIAYRDDKFVGYLRVEQVGLREAACTFSRQILPPQIGDHVVDRLE
jgi:hypothetical protein